MLAIRDVVDAANTWRVLRLEVRGTRGLPATRVEVAPWQLMRLVVANEPVLWAKLDDDYYGYHWVRAVRVPPVIAPITMEDVRAHGDASTWLPRWSRTFARALANSDASPLYAGPWELQPWTATLRGSHAEQARSFLALSAADEESGHAEWDIGRLLPPLLLRAPSSADDARVKAWRKVARAGQLPPLLLWWVAGLDREVVLDGADRLIAATLEGVCPDALVLMAKRPARYIPPKADADRELKLTIESETARAKRGWPPVPTDALNRMLLNACAPELERAGTRAWPLPGGATAWHAEVAALS